MKTLKSTALLFVVASLTFGIHQAVAVDTMTLQVTGIVTEGGNPVGSGYDIVVTNETKVGVPAFSCNPCETIANSTYAGSFVDLFSPVASTGDVIQTVIKSKDGTITLGSNTETYSSGGTITIDVEVDTSLPVELVSFTGAVINDGVRIEWRTATEVNNLGFNLYRSKTREGKFEKVNSRLIEGAGSSPLPHNYQFVDRDVKPGEVYYYYLVDIDITGTTEKSDLLEVNLKTNRSSFQARLLVPAATRLLQNFPNPFNPETWLPFYLASDTNVKIRIHNLLGETVRTLELGHKSAGYYDTHVKAAYWDGKDNIGQFVSSGLYFYTLETSDFTATRRMVIVK